MQTEGSSGSGDATERIPPPPAPPPPGYGQPMNPWQGARMPIPGNAEFLLWLVVVILFGIIALTSDDVDGTGFCTFTAVVTFAYLISRGIAKASRVLEQ
jgi:hypothetical protein